MSDKQRPDVGLVAFLRARLDEDEQMAREAGNRRWLVQDNIIELYPERENDGFMSWPTRSDAQHAARHDPARVLREVEAHRLLLDDIVSDWEQAAPGKIDQHLRQHRGSSALIDPETGEEEMIREWTVTRQLRLLALPYADHSDYREEWRP